MNALRSIIDPHDLRWIWLTHTDFDHIGSLHQLLADNPKLRIMTSFLSVGILSLSMPLPMDRVRIVNPGESVTLSDRTLHALRPPAFDNPSTTGFYDNKSGVLFSSDCFGALMQKTAQNAGDLSEEDLRNGQLFWATLDAPWLHKTDGQVLARELKTIRDIAPSMILSSHLPAANGNMTEKLLGAISEAPSAKPFAPLSQAALEQMFAAVS
jgi:flavorubredoxin